MVETNKVSIIIPVYNVIEYLDKAVSSIVSQTYKNIEILLIDDGSKDNSPQRCEFWKSKDSRIRVFHKTNGGLSSARNYGLRYASGKYIMFFDSDDWLDSNCIEVCIKYMEGYHVDCVIFPYIREFHNQSKPNYILGSKNNLISNGSVLEKKLFGPTRDEINSPQSIDDFNMACCKMYRRDVIGNTIFIPASIVGSAEDLAFNAEVFHRISKAYYTVDTFYHYNKMNASSITSSYDSELMRKQNNVYMHLEKLLKKNNYATNIKYITALSYRKVIGILSLGLNIVRCNESMRKKYNLLDIMLANPSVSSRFSNVDIAAFNMFWRFFWTMCKKRHTVYVMAMLIVAEKLKSYLK